MTTAKETYIWSKDQGLDLVESFIKRYANRYTLKDWEPTNGHVTQQGPYTVAYVSLAHRKGLRSMQHGTGFCKQRPTDRYNAEIGKQVALARAVKDALGIKERE